MSQYVLDQSLFNPSDLKTAIGEKQHPVKLFKQSIREFDEKIAELFQSGRAATELVYLRALFIDEILRLAWREYFDENFDKLTSLLAVGGYGRGELHPNSDIDLMILVKKINKRITSPVQDFITFLWDIGLEVGHSVRTVKECVVEAKQDITVATNIQESRLLIGSSDLFEKQKLRCSPKYIWKSKNFFQAKLDEQIKRHERFNDTAYNLEPNIKEGPGGLRDIQMVGWVAKRHFGAETLAELIQHDFLTETEYKTLHEGQAFLWRVRFGLHLIAGRREDRLLFEYQRKLAKQFGYRDTPKHLAVEQFMKVYYRTIMELSRLNEILLQFFQEEILYANKANKPVEINNRFQSVNDFIEVKDPVVFQLYPFALLEIFLLLEQHPELKGVRANTIREVRNHHDLIDVKFREDLRCKSLFMEILRQRHGVTHELRRMNRYGVLARYLPAFGKIVGQMQHDLFHVYTVDEHTLMVIRNLRRFTVPEFTNEFPLCSEVIQQIPKQELLILAGLFHDIAKGRGGNHSTLGAVDAKEFCIQHDLSKYDTNLVVWLVENHLLMSSTAQKQDISDPEVVYKFAKKMGDKAHLDYLYLLTVADIRATSDNVWNSWKDTLLRELYHATRKTIRKGLENPLIQSDYIDEVKSSTLKNFMTDGMEQSSYESLWINFSNEYFLRYRPDEIFWHCKNLRHYNTSDKPLILIRNSKDDNISEIFIHTEIFPELLFVVSSTLEREGVDIFDARIIKSSDNFSLDTYFVLDKNEKPLKPDVAERVKTALENNIMDRIATRTNINVHALPRQTKQFKFKTNVTFENLEDKNHTLMIATAFDRPGLLSRIAETLANHNITILAAKIATYGERAEDIFMLSDSHGNMIKTSEQAALSDEIINNIDAMIAE